MKTTNLAIAGPPQANSDCYTMMMTTYNGNGSPGGAPTGTTSSA